MERRRPPDMACGDYTHHHHNTASPVKPSCHDIVSEAQRRSRHRGNLMRRTGVSHTSEAVLLHDIMIETRFHGKTLRPRQLFNQNPYPERYKNVLPGVSSHLQQPYPVCKIYFFDQQVWSVIYQCHSYALHRNVPFPG